MSIAESSFSTNQKSAIVCLLPEELDSVKFLLATLIFYLEFPDKNKEHSKMRVRVWLTALLAFLLLILSHRTFPKIYIPEVNVSEKCVKQNSAYYIGGKIKIHNCNTQYD